MAADNTYTLIEMPFVSVIDQMVRALHDYEDEKTASSFSLKELASMLQAKCPEEAHWIKWLYAQADVIDVAISRLPEIQS